MKLYLLFFALFFLTCERGAEIVYPSGPTIYFQTTNLLPLNANEGYYEAWISFANPQGMVGQTSTTVDTSFVSIGKFNIDESGRLIGLDGKLFTARLTKPRNPQYAIDAVISIQTWSGQDTLPGSVILGGEFRGDARSGTADLSTSYREAFETDFKNAEGYFLLDAPTSTDPYYDINGIWFMRSVSPDSAGLINLPRLPQGWVYEGWLTYEAFNYITGPYNELFPMGKFLYPDSADDDLAGPRKGANGNGYDFPGQDYVQVTPFGFKPLSVMITIEPAIAGFEFPTLSLKLFEATGINQLSRRRVPHSMQQNAANFPTATITVIR